MTDVSKSVKLAGRLPGSTENNGLLSVVQELIDSPKADRMFVIWADVLKITEDVETGDHVPTLRVKRIEPMGEVDAASQALRELVMQAAEARLGHTPLPFDETDVDGVRILSFGDEDDNDGEDDD
ncbi:hypothetical protein [Kribbella catacumbae]|uniref:hypothetical protein n=1 Tax=Kribbella catacumbae TaxID=460086 RepID=UPI0003731FEF|nr:hypothetical protein [Kribbella catacumbae]